MMMNSMYTVQTLQTKNSSMLHFILCDYVSHSVLRSTEQILFYLLFTESYISIYIYVSTFITRCQTLV